MLPQYDNSLVASVYLWAEHRICNLAQAYITTTTRLYPTPDPRLPAGWVSYSAPYKQLIYDSGVSGARIINEVSGGGFSAPLTRASGIHIDYDNGRVLVPSALGANLVLTGSYSMKEINVYMPNETEDAILTSSDRFYRNPRFNGAPTSGVVPYKMVTPAIFINTLSDRSEPFALGGLQTTRTTVSITILAETDYQRKAITSLLRDAQEQCIPLLNIANDPLDEWGDVKGGTGYNYVAYVAQYGTPGNQLYVDRVWGAAISDKVKLNPGLFGGIVDMDISFVRLPA